ncbi:MAG: phospho-sugar mutase [Tannerellaceae bacterium]|jgi:phosphoglucomutase|nr:phospho-sugar mutase [Tannerellaceae bacterium]
MDDGLLQNIQSKAREWLSENYDIDTRTKVQALLDNPDPTELIDAFYRNLEFGTGGLRGVMGVGTNRMNIYTVAAATQGLANYLKRQFKQLPTICVVIGYDCRNNSQLFAQTVADIFSANGIHVYLFDDLRPTPEISFAIRTLGCQSGVIITASHNPKEYNGFKTYWDDGAQIVPPHDTLIIEEVNNIRLADINFRSRPDLIHTLGKEIDDEYIHRVSSLSLSPTLIRRHSNMKIVYTPIHGTGVYLVPNTLAAFGFTNIIHVPKQDVVSGDFPTVVSPNPEDPKALELAIQRAKETDADLVLATDPDGDRIAAAVKDNDDKWIVLNGNQAAILFTWYILERRRSLKNLRKTNYFVKTIVTSEIIRKIAEKNGVRIFDVFTGFKWIGDVMRRYEHSRVYLGGGEESFGFLWEDFVRDKDGVSAAALYAEVAAWAKHHRLTLYQLLQRIYVNFGYSKEVGISLVRKGKAGAEEITQLMKSYRSNPPLEIAGSRVIQIKDYTLLFPDMPSSTSNVIQYFTENGTKISVRPSGTEPKIKFYIEIHTKIYSVDDIPDAETEALNQINHIRHFFSID